MAVVTYPVIDNLVCIAAWEIGGFSAPLDLLEVAKENDLLVFLHAVDTVTIVPMGTSGTIKAAGDYWFRFSFNNGYGRISTLDGRAIIEDMVFGMVNSLVGINEYPDNYFTFTSFEKGSVVTVYKE